MLGRALVRCLSVATAAALLSTTAAAATPANGVALDRLEPQAWLQQVHRAVSMVNYQGTLVSTAGGAVTSSRIAHFWDAGQQYERVEILDGQARQVYRHNDLVYTLWPAQRLAVVEQRDASNALPSLLRASPDDRVFERYELRAEGGGRVAGLEATVFVLHPRDDARFAQRLWAEKRTGLLLRSDVLASDGRVLESAAFSDVMIGVKPQPESVLRPMKKLDGYRVERPGISATDLEAEGWRLSPVTGFRQVSCVRRKVDRPGADHGEYEHEQVLQAVFSDGLTHVSVFIEPYREGRHRAGKMAIGATHTLMRRHDQWWITVMGDVPMPTVVQFANAIERRR